MDSSGEDIVSPGIRLAVLISSVVSLAGCLVVIVLSILFKKIKKVCWRAIFYACISEAICKRRNNKDIHTYKRSHTFFFLSLSLTHSCLCVVDLDLIICYICWDDIHQVPDKVDSCDILGFLLTITSLITNSWLLFIAVVMFNLVVRKSNEIIVSKKMEIIWVVFFMLFSILCGLLPFEGINLAGMSYDKVSPGWCHISHDPSWAPMYLYVIQWVFIGLIVLIYIYVYAFANILIRRQREKIILTHADHNMRRRIFTLFKQVWVFPLILVVSWIPTTTCRIVVAIQGDKNNASTWVTAIVVPLMGFLLFVCFMLTSYVPKEIAHFCTKYNRNRRRKKLKSIVGSEDDDYEEYDDDAIGSEKLLSEGLTSSNILK